MEAEADDGTRKAVGSRVVGEIYGSICREPSKDLLVLGEPPMAILEDDKDHLTLEVMGGDVEGEKAIIKCMEYVACVPTRREEESWDIVMDITRELGNMGGVDGAKAELIDFGHEVSLPFTCVGFDLFLMWDEIGIIERGVKEDGRRRGISSYISHHEADITMVVGSVTADGVVGEGGARGLAKIIFLDVDFYVLLTEGGCMKKGGGEKQLMA